ncbi:hypothetical protein BLNAU_5562 [Blattamonas nauphoetae]|uniref:Protein kinase domain-containing protein n=1 Tax=Blattamonas nauphoetae TaxID=2049346 RepID=A0ABQ9Y736_9EUKA|nr:hypothetical protein BLNAU_5562 [Blattamonas nauphoetae]
MILIPLLVLSQAISLHNVLSQHVSPNHPSRISTQQVTLGSNQYECGNVGIMDNIVELQGTTDTVFVLERASDSSKGVESLLRIWNSTVEMDQLRLDGWRQDSENSEDTMICVVGSVLRWTNQICRATTSIVADSGNLGLTVSVVSCNLDCGRIGSWNGLLVDERKASTSNSVVVRIETLLSDCRLENVTGVSSNRRADGGSKLWRQRLLSNSISKSSSVLSGTVIRDFNDGGDLLCSNTTFTSCSTSTVRPLTRRSIETSLLAPYLRPNLRRHKSQDGRCEWQDAAFGTGTLFDFYDFSSKGERYFARGVNFFFSTCDDSIHFTRCNFTNIDGTDPTDGEFRGVSGTAILVRCPSSILVEHCTFESCSSQVFSGAIHVELEHETPSLTVLSSSFTDCFSGDETQPSAITQFSLGTTTLHDCQFTHSISIENKHTISSEGMIASNCHFSLVNHNDPYFYFVHCRTIADFRFCRFHSLTQLSFDAMSDYSWELSFLGCVSNSWKAEEGLTFGLFPPTVGEAEYEVIAESSLNLTLNDHPSATTIFVGTGDFGMFEISARIVTLKGCRQSESADSSSSLVSKLSGCVKSDGECSLLNLHLAPHSTQHSILTSNGMCFLQYLLIDGIDNQTVPLFVFSGLAAAITVSEIKFRNIHNAEAALVEVKSEASFTLYACLFVHISSSASVISVLPQGSITVTSTSFSDINTTGTGPAAIDIESPKSKGEAGSIRVVNASPNTFIALNLLCLSNRGADNAPTDILFDGLSKTECEQLLLYSKHFGVGPHYGWRKGEDIGTADAPAQYLSNFEICSFPGFVSQEINNLLVLHPSDVDFSTLLNRMKPSSTLYVSVESVLNTPLVQKPFELDNAQIVFNDGHPHSPFTIGQLQQAVSEDVPLALMKNASALKLHALVVLVDSRNTAAMFVVADADSYFNMSSCIVVGDDESIHRPFVQSQGVVSLNGIHFRDMNFGSRSCIELNGGKFHSSSDNSGSFMGSAVNLTTTGHGAFISSQNFASIDMNFTYLVNCSAESGGALFFNDTGEVRFQNLHFIGCSAKDDGGAAKIIQGTKTTALTLALECVNCTARRGGGLFLFGVSAFVTIKGVERLEYFKRQYQTHAFENCIAEQGGGIFVDGFFSYLTITFRDVGFNNWNAEGLGTDVYVVEGVIVDDVDSFVQNLKSSCRSMSRQSTDLSKLCHVHIEESTPRSFNLPFPQLSLDGFGYDFVSPLVQEDVNYFFEIAQYVHHKDEDGNNLKTDIILNYSFYLSERGYCTDHSDPNEEDPDPVSIEHDGIAPLEEHVLLEIGADARVEFHDLIFAVDCPAQMMLLTDASAEGLVEQCSFWYHPTTDPLLGFDVALFEVVDGTLTLKNLIFTLFGGEENFGADDFVLSGAPLVLVSPSTSLSATPTVQMDNVTFERMRLADGVEALMVFDVSASVSVNDLKCVDCNQTESVETTRIVVTGRSLERVDTSKWKGFDSLTLADRLNWGIDTSEGSGSIWRVVPLRVVLTHFTNTTIKTEESGKDMVGCGEGEWSCRGLVRAGKNVGGDTGCTITVVGSSFLDGVFDPATKLTTIKSSSSKSVIVVTTEGVIMNSPDGDNAPFLTLSRLSFSLPPSLNSDSLMKSLGGELKIENCWFVCSSAIDFSLVSATGGIATITELSLSSDLRFSKPAFAFSDLSSAKFHTLDSTAHFDGALISAKGTPTGRWKLTITQSSIKGSETERNEEHNENANLCAWSSGAVELEDVNCEVSWTTFSHLGQGAMHARNSNVTFHQSSVTNNGISTGLFPSARQNIRCVGSSRISFETSAMGTGEGKNGWVSGDSECVVEGVVGEERKLFFEPTLDSKLSLSTLNKKEKKYEVWIVGSTLIPCGLSLEVFENENSSSNRVVIPLSEIASEWNETSLSLVIPATRLSSLSNTPQWLGRISFGGVHSTDSFEMKLSAKMAQANQMKKTLPWLIPLIVVLSLLLIVGIVIFILCRRRKQKNPSNTSEMEPTEPIEDEKMDVLLNTQSHPPNSALSTLNSKCVGADDQITQVHPAPVDSDITVPAPVCIEALACSGKMEMALVQKQDTLFTRLHTEQGRKVALTTESVRRQLLRGIEKIWETDKHASILTKLSSHVVMVDFANNVFLNMNSDGATLGENGQNKEATLLEQKRWSAPELDEENGGNSKSSEKEIDYSKAAVFSLGLILWELETGLVPFGEIDAMNAQRQLGVGSTLKMEGIKDSAMKDVISQCISINPDERQTLTELNEMINPTTEALPLPSNCSDS